MQHLAYLIVMYKLGSDYHSGQASNGYKMMCQAQQRLAEHHNIFQPSRIVDHLRCHTLYPKGGDFRNAVAYYLKKFKKYRWKL